MGHRPKSHPAPNPPPGPPLTIHSTRRLVTPHTLSPSFPSTSYPLPSSHPTCEEKIGTRSTLHRQAPEPEEAVNIHRLFCWNCQELYLHYTVTCYRFTTDALFSFTMMFPRKGNRQRSQGNKPLWTSASIRQKRGRTYSSILALLCIGHLQLREIDLLDRRRMYRFTSGMSPQTNFTHIT